jgi:hypothetical protein
VPAIWSPRTCAAVGDPVLRRAEFAGHADGAICLAHVSEIVGCKSPQEADDAFARAPAAGGNRCFITNPHAFFVEQAKEKTFR